MSVEPAHQRIFDLWVELSRARYRREVLEQEMKTNPWESTDAQVKVAWEKLTDPNNLMDLERWGADPEKMNPVAREATANAIECCRKRTGSLS